MNLKIEKNKQLFLDILSSILRGGPEKERLYFAEHFVASFNDHDLRDAGTSLIALWMLANNYDSSDFDLSSDGLSHYNDDLLWSKVYKKVIDIPYLVIVLILVAGWFSIYFLCSS